MASPPRKDSAIGSRSLPIRVLRYIRRKLSTFSGPRVQSVQHLSNDKFLRLFAIEGAASIPGLIKHFGDRIDSGWREVPDVLTDLRLDMSKMTDNEIVARADRALAGDLHPSGVRPLTTSDGRINWFSNPSGSREWMLMLHRHSWWALWAAAFARTNDEKYALEFVSQLTDWIDSHPLPRQKSEHYEPWRLMEVGLRMRVSWIPAFGCFFHSAAFTDSAKSKMLRALYDHGQFLEQFFTNRNHLVRESNGLVALALCYPEFVDAKVWLEKGLQRLDQELQAQLNQDGSHIEMSVGYQWLTIDEFEVTRDLLQRHELQLPQSDLAEALKKMYAYLAAVIRPDLTFPQLNDGFILWDALRLEGAGRVSGWSQIEFVGSGGKTGSAPPGSSASFPNAGIHIMRSGWDEEARYLVADTGPYGGPHGHEDKLSFEVFAYGAPFIVDPGSYTYEKSDPYREYFVGSQGHNTVLVDGKSQVRRWNAKHMTPVARNEVHGVWSSDADIDFASGCYDEGYAPFSLVQPQGQEPDTDVVHRRDFIFVKPDYWLLVDYLHASNIHEYDFAFHLAPDTDIEDRSDTSAVVRSNRNGARLKIQALSAATLKNAIHIGEEAPIQGWYSSDHHKKCPAPAIVFKASNASSICVGWLLYPLPPEGKPDSIVAGMTPGSEKMKLGIAVNSGARTDTFSIESDRVAGDARSRLSASRITIDSDGIRKWSAEAV